MAVTNFFDGRGGFAGSTIARSESAFRVPDAMRDEDAAAFRIGYSTAYIGLMRRGALRPGERLVVLGAAGGSGLAATHLEAALGARGALSIDVVAADHLHHEGLPGGVVERVDAAKHRGDGEDHP